MKFWDSSGIVPLCVIEPTSERIMEILRGDQAMVVWWATRIECISAFVRRTREGILDAGSEEQSRIILRKLARSWIEIQPTQGVRESAERLLAVHPLRTADALQLAAALMWTRRSPLGHHFVCLDHLLREAARKEGFALLPTL
ncbi:MAG: type II toxin-antitoxin system VapC family toxin [Nitrospiria bacterium]